MKNGKGIILSELTSVALNSNCVGDEISWQNEAYNYITYFQLSDLDIRFAVDSIPLIYELDFALRAIEMQQNQMIEIGEGIYLKLFFNKINGMAVLVLGETNPQEVILMSEQSPEVLKFFQNMKTEICDSVFAVNPNLTDFFKKFPLEFYLQNHRYLPVNIS